MPCGVARSGDSQRHLQTGNRDTAGELRQWLAGQGRERLATARNLRCAVNQDMAGPEAAVRDGDEVAFFPPVTGG